MNDNVNKTVDTEPENTSSPEETQNKMQMADLLSGFVLLAIGLWILFSGIYMIFDIREYTDGLYSSPGIFPIFIGSVLSILSVFLILKSRSQIKCLKGFRMANLSALLKSSRLIRLAVAVGLLALYVFVALGRLPFMLCTFLYLIANMLFFREKSFPVWKLLIISAVTSAALYLGFGILAGIPLP